MFRIDSEISFLGGILMQIVKYLLIEPLELLAFPGLDESLTRVY